MYKDKRIIFITEGGLKIGLGHVMRCIAVAEYIRDLKRKPFFIVNNSKAVADILKKRNFHFNKVFEITRAIIQYKSLVQNKPVLIDSKKDVSNLIRGLQKNGCKVTLLDNITGARLYADNVIYPFEHLNPKRLNWKKAKGKLYYGAKYFPLRKEFININRKERKNYILVSMGGVDSNNLTKLVLESLEGTLPNIKIITVVTKAFRHKSWLENYKRNIKKNYEIIDEPKDFSKLLSKARLVITALGITIYEAAYFGIPTLVINNYKTDLNDNIRLENLGLCKPLGYYKNVDLKGIVDNVKNILFSKKCITKLSRRKLLVDKGGVKRIASIVLR